MPTLLRLLTVLAIVAAIVYAIMAALIHFVEPRESVIVEEVPLEGYGPLAPVPDRPGAPLTAPPG